MQAEEHFNKLISDIPGGKPGKMFTALCVKMPNGKAGAMLWRNFLVVKLPEKERNEALSLDGVTLFDPMDGRPMKEWVQVPFEYKAKWKNYLKISTKIASEMKVQRKSKSKSPVKSAKKKFKKR